MLFERPYNDITVGEVAEQANVGRSTFYEHFRTKSDLLKHTVAAPFSVLAAATKSSEPDTALVPMLQHFRENHSLGRVLFAQPTRAILLRVLTAEIEKCLEASAFPAPVLAAQIAAAQMALVEPWSLGQIAASADLIAEALCRTSFAMAQAMNAAKNSTTSHPFVR